MGGATGGDVPIGVQTDADWAAAIKSMEQVSRAVVAIVLVLCAVFAHVLAPADPNRQNLVLRLQPPATEVQIAGVVHDVALAQSYTASLG